MDKINPNQKVTPEMAKRMISMRESGTTFKDIGDHFGVTINCVKCWVVPGFRERRRKSDQARYDRVRKGERGSTRTVAVLAEEEWRKQLPRLPKGPTNWNQALLGDPLPGRSALDQRSNI